MAKSRKPATKIRQAGAAGLVAVGGLAVGATVASAVSDGWGDSGDTSESAATTSALSGVKTLPNGETAGRFPVDNAAPGAWPDLVAAIGDGGVEGYIRKDDLLEPVPSSPAEALAEQRAARRSGVRSIPLYAADGETVIDHFTLDNSTGDTGMMTQ